MSRGGNSLLSYCSSIVVAAQPLATAPNLPGSQKMKSTRRFGLGGRRRGSHRRETLVMQVGFFVVGVIAVVLMGEIVENQALWRGSSGDHSVYRALQERNGSESVSTTAFSNSTTQNSCGLTWAFDEWAYVLYCVVFLAVACLLLLGLCCCYL